MRLIAFGGDARTDGVLDAAEKAGWETLHITGEYGAEIPSADAVLLPWARSFRENGLVVQQGEKSMTRESVLAKIPPCAAALVGRDVRDEELPQVGRVIRPDGDERFLRLNARLTAEGAMMTLMRVRKRALLSSTAVITGYGRIGQEMAARLCAMGTFVIVCARSEEQMRMAHAAGAHPVPLSRLAAACRQADVIVNTIPAHVLGADALEAIGGIRPSLSWQARRMAWICRKPFVGACRSAWRAVCRDGMRRWTRAARCLTRWRGAWRKLKKGRKRRMSELRIGFAITGSFCTFKAAFPQMNLLVEHGYRVIPIMSDNAYGTDTRFGNAADWVAQAEEICGEKVIHTIAQAEPIGPKKLLDLLIIAPCTGNTLGKLACGIYDTAPTLAVKSHRRNGRPVLIAVSTNDALAGAAAGIGLLMNRRGIYFVPFEQDDHRRSRRAVWRTLRRFCLRQRRRWRDGRCSP